MARRHSIFSGSRFILKALVFTLVATAVWLLANVGSLREFLDTYHRRKAEEDQIAILRARIENLKGQQRSLELGGVETERQVRERFRMHKPGEQVIFLEETDERSTRTTAGGTATTATAQAAAGVTTPTVTDTIHAAPPPTSAREPDGTAVRRTAQRGAPAKAAAEPGASAGAAEARDASPNTTPEPAASANAAPAPGDPALALPSRPRLEGSRALPGPARKP